MRLPCATVQLTDRAWLVRAGSMELFTRWDVGISGWLRDLGVSVSAP